MVCILLILKKSFCGHKWLAHLFYNKIIPRDVKEPPLENKIQNFIVPYILCQILPQRRCHNVPMFHPISLPQRYVSIYSFILFYLESPHFNIKPTPWTLATAT